MVDEAGHLASGLVHWKAGDFRPYGVNPPMIRMLGTAPLLLLAPSVPLPIYHGSAYDRPELTLANAFAMANAGSYLTLVRVARWAPIALTLAASGLVWGLAREAYGAGGGLVALALWGACPLALGHGHLLTADVGAATFGLLAHRAFLRRAEDGSMLAAIQCGLALGLALLAKFTLLALIPAWLALGLHRALRCRLGLQPLHVGVGALACLMIIHVGYGFDRTLTPLGDFGFISRTLAGGHAPWQGANRFRGTWLGAVPVPLPAEMVLGVDRQWYDFDVGQRSYLRGEYRHGGWWYYYFYGLAVKLPVGHLAILAATVALAVARRNDPGVRVWMPGIFLLALISSQTGFSHHIRYCLPALPFFYVAAGRLGHEAARGVRWAIVIVVLGLTASFVSVLRNHPHHLAYFNELAGGPLNGHRHLLDSNLDWGQDLLRLRRWLERHPDAVPLHLAAYHIVNPAVLGIDYREVPPVAPLPPAGTYVLSMNVLLGYEGTVFREGGQMATYRRPDYSYLAGEEPEAFIGHSLRVYRIGGARPIPLSPARGR